MKVQLLELCALIALAGCGSTQAASSAAPVSTPTSPAYAACSLATAALNAVAAPIAKHQVVQTGAIAGSYGAELGSVMFDAALSFDPDLEVAIEDEAGALQGIEGAASSVEGPDYPGGAASSGWELVAGYVPRLASAFRQVESACAAEGISIG